MEARALVKQTGKRRGGKGRFGKQTAVLRMSLIICEMTLFVYVH